jgi:oligoribonuclease (3'-5' exoribonuclease)
MKFLILDFETTGVNEREHLPLELGALVVSNEPEDLAKATFKGVPFVVLEQWESLIRTDVADAKSRADDFVLDLHTRDGLWAALEASPDAPELPQVQQSLLDLLDRRWGPGGGKILLAGYSVAFDHRWAAYHLPAVAKRLDYHVLDVSSHRRIWALAGLPKYPVGAKKAHRALADCQEVAEELAWYLTHMRGPDFP